MGMTGRKAIEEYGWLVDCLAGQYLRPGVELSDLKQEAYLGLLAACDEWIDGAGMSFVTLARMRIRNALRDFLNGHDGETVSFDQPNEEGLSLHDVVGTPAEQEAAAIRREEVDAVQASLACVSDADRLLLRVWAECHVDSRDPRGACPEMAQRLGVSRETIRDRCKQAFKRFGDEIAPFLCRVA